MRGRSQDQGGMFSYIHPEKRIPAYHPLRKIRELVREVLKELNHTFGRLYSDGTAERRASEAMLKKQAKGSKRITVGEDKAYDTSDHIAALRRMNVTPHVAQNDSLTKTGKRRRSAIDARTTRHIGYQISQTCRKMAECIFGWGKQHGTMRKTKHRGIAAVAADFMLHAQSYRLQSRADSQAHRRLRRSLPASRKTGSDRPKSNNKGRKRLGYRRFFSKLLKRFATLGPKGTHAREDEAWRPY